MDVRKAVLGGLWLGLLCGAWSLWAGEAAPAPAAPPADVEALKKQAQELRGKEREVRTKLIEIETRIRAMPDVVKLHEAEQAAEKAYEEKRKADPAYTAARKAEADAQLALARLVQEKLAASDEAKAVQKELDDLDAKRAGFDFDEAMARFVLDYPSSPINYALSKDPELLKLRKAADEAPAADKEARDKARKAYDEARKAKKDAMPEAKKLMARIEEARKARADLRTAEAEVMKKLAQARRAIEETNDPDIKAAREKIAAAAKAVTEASNGDDLKAARKARDEARIAYYAKVRELVAADAASAALLKERDELGKQIFDLTRKVREMTK